MESVGARLKQLRLEKGASLEDINKKTKINPDILKSLEEDALATLNPVYLKGFIKSYCQSLGVDPAEYLHAAESPAQRQSGPHETQEPRMFNPITQATTPGKLKIVVIAAGIVAVVLVAAGLVSLVRFSFVKISESVKRHTERAAVERVREAKKAPPVRQKTAGPAAPRTQQTATSPVRTPAGTVNISIQALEDCWIQVKADSKTVFQNVLKRGRSETWSAKDRIELTLGSAGGVRLEVNGKLMPALGHKGQVLKNITITREGLKVGR